MICSRSSGFICCKREPAAYRTELRRRHRLALHRPPDAQVGPKRIAKLLDADRTVGSEIVHRVEEHRGVVECHMYRIHAGILQFVQPDKEPVVKIHNRATKPFHKRRIALEQMPKRLSEVPRRNIEVARQHRVPSVGLSLSKSKIPFNRFDIYGSHVIVAVWGRKAPRTASALYGKQNSTVPL